MNAPRDFLLFALGPVQSFIATARRTQDLGTSSRLLCHLVTTALDTAVRGGAEPVFPVKQGGQWPKTVPNRAVLLVSPDVSAAVARQMTISARRRWLFLAASVRRWLQQKKPALCRGAAWHAIWHRQVPSWLEVYWVTDAWHGDYSTALAHADALMNARKLLRPIPSHGEPDEKCSLCGVRQALRGQESAATLWSKLREGRESALRVGEQLCAVCTVKRFAHDSEAPRSQPEKIVSHRCLRGDRLPSTSSIAAADYRLTIVRNWDACRSAATDLVQYIKELRGSFIQNGDEPNTLLSSAAITEEQREFLRLEGSCLFEEFYTEANLAEELGYTDKLLPADKRDWMECAAAALRALYQVTDELPSSRPSRYLAVLRMDGDHIGPLLRNKETPAAHEDLSGQLAHFAQVEAPRIVQCESPGILIYSGGDDALALMPLSCALSVAAHLCRAFSDTVEGQATSSFGLALVHRLSSLPMALAAARAAEERAKDDFDRDALVIQVLRRSGEERETGARWIGQPERLTELLSNLNRLFAEGQLSARFVYAVLQEAPALLTLPPDGKELALRRLLLRHLADADRAREISSQLVELLCSHLAIRWQPDLGLLAHWLVALRLINQRDRE